MRHYLVFRRSPQEHKVLETSGYPWAALLFSPLWAFSKGLNLHGAILVVLYGCCVALTLGAVTNGIVVGVAIALWLGVFTAHNATDWLTSSYKRRGYREMSGGIEAGSAQEALQVYREPTRPTVLMGAIQS